MSADITPQSHELREDKKSDVVDYVTSATDPESNIGDGEVDGVWGVVDSAKGPNYRNLGWIRASVLLTKVQIGLGILAIPSTLDVLGLVPGILVILLTAIFTTWTDYVIGTFKMNHPQVYTLADVGQIMGGRFGRELLGGAYWIYLTAVAGASMLGIATAFNAMSTHGACTVLFAAIGAIFIFIVSAIQTLDKISWIGWVGLVCLLSSVITLTVAVGVSDRPSAAPATGPFTIEVVKIGHPGFVTGIAAVANIIFSFAGAPNFFPIASEMRRVRDYTKSVIACQSFVTATYLIVGCTVYHFVGQYIASPALGSASVLLKKVCYGLALPGLIVGGVLNTHLPAKYLFVRLLKGSKHLTSNTVTHRVVWYSCVAFNCIISFIIAESIPVFGDLISLVGALLATPLCLCVQPVMWYWDARTRSSRNTKYYLLCAFNALILVTAAFCSVGGTYAAIVTINDSVKTGSTSQPFSCADNSNST